MQFEYSLNLPKQIYELFYHPVQVLGARVLQYVCDKVCVHAHLNCLLTSV